MTNQHTPPKDLLEAMQYLDWNEALPVDDARWVDTEDARGSHRAFATLLRNVGYDINRKHLRDLKQQHVLLYGHVGSGKSTELNRLAQRLAPDNPFLIIHLDVANELDRNNLQYADVLMALAHKLVEEIERRDMSISPDALKPLEDWFYEQVLTKERQISLGMELETGVQISAGIPMLAKLFSKFKSYLRTNSAYKEALRLTVRNGFTFFAIAFNALLTHVEMRLRERGVAKRVLFVVDGTDKLTDEDNKRFFIVEASQLLAIEGLVIYTAPLHMRFQGSVVQTLEHVTWPMIKAVDKNGNRVDLGHQALSDILLHRVDSSVFAPGALDRLVEMSGGHPRELLRLFRKCCELADENRVTEAIVQRAIELQASEYLRWLTAEHYTILAAEDIRDQGAPYQKGMDQLIINVALLEYNEGSWRRSHPVVRTLISYQEAVVRRDVALTAEKRALEAATAPPTQAI